MGTFDDGSPRYDHGHRPDGTVWEAEPDDDFDPWRDVPHNARPLLGIARFAIVALEAAAEQPEAEDRLIRRWRAASSRTNGTRARRGRRMGEMRTCPFCRHEHAVGTTCSQCPACPPDMTTVASAVFAELLPGGVAERVAFARHDEALRLRGRCDGACGVAGCGAPGYGPDGLTHTGHGTGPRWSPFG